MKVLWRYNTGMQHFREMDEPEIQGAQEVKIRVTYNMIGIQDMRMARDWDFYSKPGIAGYEMSGVIEDLGEKALERGLYIGQRVTGTIVEFCGHCPYCQSGQEHMCMELQIHSGTLCDYVIWHMNQVIPIPEGMTDAVATLTEPVAVVKMAAQKLGLNNKKRICIFGGDFNGLVLLQLAKTQGVERVMVVEPKEYNRELAKELGADYVIDPADESYTTDLLRQTGFIGYEGVAVTSSHSEWIQSALDVTAAEGTVLFTVYYDHNIEIGINSIKLFKMGMTITSSLLYTKDLLYQTIHEMNDLRLEELVVGEYPFEEALLAYDKEKENLYPRIGIRGAEK